MNRRNAAFSLLELMIAMAIVMVVLYAAINFFIISVRQYKVQTKITETNLEGILGLELFRQDLESLGFGLPWNNLVAYTERTGVHADIVALTDSPNAPRAVLSVNDPAFTFNNSDYLVIKSARVGMKEAAGKWTTLTQANVKRTWSQENLANTDYVIVLALGTTDANRRSLVTSGTFDTQYNNTAGFVPVEPYSANIVYGIDDVGTGLVRPFNRAEYYIDSTPPVPSHCATNTGVLVKAVVEHDANGTTPMLLPLLDCVADLQVVYGLDADADPATPLVWSNNISLLAADAIRAQLQEVRVHILAQVGQRDNSYTYPYDNVTVGSEGGGRSFDFTTSGITGFRNYRWRVYNIAVKPKNLAQ
ncbi:MAG: prepilin-type N-terminal cleavage/methylation domain-containing protein [Deltaproteobacteria bacterium]|nr:MAG: prepilin-type N-terminal cleavage/methylation domain-containing protein [Deltaproteobacteria bacterium]